MSERTLEQEVIDEIAARILEGQWPRAGAMIAFSRRGRLAADLCGGTELLEIRCQVTAGLLAAGERQAAQIGEILRGRR